jgi:hypothetical protein
MKTSMTLKDVLDMEENPKQFIKDFIDTRESRLIYFLTCDFVKLKNPNADNEWVINTSLKIMIQYIFKAGVSFKFDGLGLDDFLKDLSKKTSE